jgi:transcriptional regulator with XRE-family HTH domain
MANPVKLARGGRQRSTLKYIQIRYIELQCSIMDTALRVKPRRAKAPTRRRQPECPSEGGRIEIRRPPESPMSPPPPEPPRVGQTLATLRQSRNLTLDELSRQAGVSKSMLSQIERNQANPTVAVVWRLANALGVPLAELLGGDKPAGPAIATVASHATPSLRSPDGRCELRILGPIELAGQFEWYELTVQPGGALESEAHEPGSREHLSVLGGHLSVQTGADSTGLGPGETARYAVDQVHAIRNPGKVAAQALLVVIHLA